MSSNITLIHGGITESFYNKKLLEYRSGQENIQTKLKNLQNADKDYYTTGIYLLKLANRAPAIFKSSEVEVKRQLIKLVLQNPTVNDVTLKAAIRKPFSLWAEGPSRTKWLPLYDLFRNHDANFRAELSSIKLLVDTAKIVLV